MFPPREPRPEHGIAASARLGRVRAVASAARGIGGGSLALPLAACGARRARPVQRQGAVHPEVRLLPRAHARRHAGPTGPNLDAAFRAAWRTAFTRETVEGIVHRQILHPRRNSTMPAELVKGEDAEDVAAYVAFAVEPQGPGPGRAGAGGPGGGHDAASRSSPRPAARAATRSPRPGANGNIGPSLDDLASSPDIKGIARGLRAGSRSLDPDKVDGPRASTRA